MIATEVAKVAAVLYTVETLSLQAQGETQTLAPEAFVPGAVRILREAQRAEGLGWDVYLAAGEAAAIADAPQPLVTDAPPARGDVGDVGDAGDVGDLGTNARE